MQRRNREINIFNMSALDLFASALGAFILLFVILMPYYLKTSKIVMQENAQLKTEIRECLAQTTNLKKKVDNLQGQVKDLQQQLAICEQQKQHLQADNDQLKQQLKQIQKDLYQAQKSLEDRVEFALLGINTKARSFVVVVDMSGSMKEYAAIIIHTVARILEPLDDKTKMQIFGFNENGFKNWQSPFNLANLTDVNKQAANDFINQLTTQFTGGTPTKTALLEALKYEAKAIILLTDGQPTEGDQLADPLELINTVTVQNVGKKEIHSVAIGEYNKNPNFVIFLQELSARNGGSFVGISK